MWSSSTPRSRPSVQSSSDVARIEAAAAGLGVDAFVTSPPSACVRTCSKPAALRFLEPGFGHAGRDGVILGQARQPAAAQQVEPAVADVREVQHRRNPPGGGERGAHAGRARRAGARAVNRSIARPERALEPAHRIVAVDAEWTSSLSRTLTASRLATSPPGWPPMPSATTSSDSTPRAVPRASPGAFALARGGDVGDQELVLVESPAAGMAHARRLEDESGAADRGSSFEGSHGSECTIGVVVGGRRSCRSFSISRGSSSRIDGPFSGCSAGAVPATAERENAARRSADGGSSTPFSSSDGKKFRRRDDPWSRRLASTTWYRTCMYRTCNDADPEKTTREG